MSASLIQPIRGPGVIASPLPISPAIRAGDFRLMSGMASADENGKLVPDTFENEARRTYGNVARTRGDAGLDFSRVAQVRCYLSGKKDWDAHNPIHREFFSEPFPARTALIGCLGDLVKYEVDLIAYAGGSGGSEGPSRPPPIRIRIGSRRPCTSRLSATSSMT